MDFQRKCHGSSMHFPFSMYLRWISNGYSINFQSMFVGCPTSHFRSPISHFYVYVPFRSSFAHFPFLMLGLAECAERLNPPPLPYGKSWRVESKAQVRISDHILQISDPLKISPSTPVHSARPTQIDRPPGFCDFQKTIASAEPAETSHAGWNLLRIWIENASFKMPLLCFSCFNSLFTSHFFKNVVPASAGSTFLQNDENEMHQSRKMIENEFCNLHFQCKFVSKSVADNYFEFRSVTACVFWKS